MNAEQKKEKILSAIAARGWSLAEVHFSTGKALEAEGKVKLSDRYFTGGNCKFVWVAA